jgi:hypothetical protein
LPAAFFCQRKCGITDISESFFIDIGLIEFVMAAIWSAFAYQRLSSPRRLIVALLCGRYQTQSDIQMLAIRSVNLAPLPSP